MTMAEEIEIDNKTYKLSTKNYNNKTSKKNKVLIVDSYNKDMNHFTEWNIFDRGNYKKTAHYTINYDGIIYEHYSPKKCSDYLKKGDKDHIIVMVENIGWLEGDGDTLKTWTGEIYKGETTQQYWRDKEYWVNYNKPQLDSTIKLIKHLVETMGIKSLIKENAFLDSEIKNFEGILYKSNLNVLFKDINPSWDFERLKKEVG